MIKTYTFESGLFYLAKSLGDKLIREGHEIAYIPKSKYIQDGRVFKRTYVKSNNQHEFKRIPCFEFDTNKSVEALVFGAVTRFRADYIISFETLMQKSRWINIVKSKSGVKVIDVPMIEWVTPSFLERGYGLFDEIWALTDHTYDFFKNYQQSKRVSWDYVDRDLFYPANKKSDGVVKYYHASSLNQQFSSKNTDKVLKAFDRFLDKHNPNAELIITGDKIGYSLNKIVEKHTNITLLDRVLSRSEIADIYREVDCILAPSSREGLGMNLFEAAACNCKIITTNVPPMNYHDTSYLCEPSYIKKDNSLVGTAEIDYKEIYKNLVKSYKDITCQKQT